MAIKVGKITDCFTSCYTTKGYVTFLNNVVKNEKVYVLKGGAFQVKSRIIRDMGNNLVDRGFDINLLHNGVNPDILEGILVYPLNVAIIDGNHGYVENGEENMLNLEELVDSDKLKGEIQKELEELKAKKVYFENQYHLRVQENIGEDITIIPGAKHKFAEALTYKGKASYYENLLKDIDDKYYVNNLDYEAASQILTFFAKEMQKGKLNTEIYHNFLEPEIIELIIVRDNELAISIKSFSGEFKPINNANILFIETIRTDQEILKEYVDILGSINKLNGRIEEKYLGATDFSKISYIGDLILADIVRNMLQKTSK